MKSPIKSLIFDYQLLSKYSIFKIFCYLLALVICLLPRYDYVFGIPNPFLIFPLVKSASGIDPSFVIAINWAVEKQLVFGEEFIYTYGPLGFLYTKLPLSFSIIPNLVFYCLVLANQVFITHYLIQKTNSVKLLLAWFLALLIVPDTFGEHILFFQMLFFSFYGLRNKQYFCWINAAFIAVLMFYTKLSFGLLVNVLLYFFLIYSVSKKQISWKNFSLILLFHSSILMVLASLLHVNLSAYLYGTYQIMQTHIDATQAYNKVSLFFLFFVFLMLLRVLLFVKQNFKILFGNLETGLFFLILILSQFFLFKHAYYRADMHVLIFFGNSALFLFLFFVLNDELPFKNLKKLIYFFIIICLPARYLYPPIYNLSQDEPVKAYFKSHTTAIIPTLNFLWNQIITYSNSKNSLYQQTPKLSVEFLSAIGKSSVDIIPYDIAWIHHHHLNYNPRLMVQSYLVYNQYFEEKNSQKYQSNSAPEYLIFSPKDIDGRYLFFTESITKQAILENYELKLQSNSLLLLKKKIKNKTLKTNYIENKFTKLNEFIPLKNTEELQYLTAKIEYNLWGKLLRLSFQPPQLQVTFRLKDDSEHTFRAIKPILETGVLVNRFINDIEASKHFFAKDFTKIPIVKAIKFHSNLPIFWIKDFQVKIKHKTLRNKNEP